MGPVGEDEVTFRGSLGRSGGRGSCRRPVCWGAVLGPEASLLPSSECPSPPPCHPPRQSHSTHPVGLEGAAGGQVVLNL